MWFSNCFGFVLFWIEEKHCKSMQGNLSNPSHQGIREMCRIIQDVRILMFYFRTINFCQMSQDVGKLRCQIAQVALYIREIISINKLKLHSENF